MSSERADQLQSADSLLVFSSELLKMKNSLSFFVVVVFFYSSTDVHANQNVECGWRVLLCAACPQSQGCIQVCLQSSALIPGCCAWNKEAFHIDLDTLPPPSPQEPAERNPLQLSDINLSVPPGRRSQLRAEVKLGEEANAHHMSVSIPAEERGKK